MQAQIKTFQVNGVDQNDAASSKLNNIPIFIKILN